MSAALPILSFGLLGGVASKLLASKPAAQPAPTPMPTRNAAAEAAIKDDLLARRRGIAANMLLGATGSESGAGKTALGT
jgi:hypothetical protein